MFEIKDCKGISKRVHDPRPNPPERLTDDHLTVNDLSTNALDYFRKKAIKSKRLEADIWEDSN